MYSLQRTMRVYSGLCMNNIQLTVHVYSGQCMYSIQRTVHVCSGLCMYIADLFEISQLAVLLHSRFCSPFVFFVSLPTSRVSSLFVSLSMEFIF